MEENLQQHNIRVIISGGGTGGHIFPALAIANALKKINPANEILFVGAEGRMEMEKVPAAGYKIEGLWISGFQRKLTLDNLSFPFKLISSLRKAGKIVKQFKPDVAVGVGGYASGPLLQKAASNKVPCLIQEQNSYPGVTNKILAKQVDTICVAYDGMDKYFPTSKIKKLGNPVRADILNTEGKKSDAAKFFGLDENKKTVLVVGGSLGARTINLSILNKLDAFNKADVQLIWQTGKSFYEQAATAAANFKNIKVFDFITKMDFAFAMADVVISRAGASTISELCIVAKPCVLVPSPNVAEDHQTKNALALVNVGAAILIKDNEANDKLVNQTLELLNNTSSLEQLIQNIKKLALPDSAMKIANEVIALATKNKK
jgi:UDP-N-acetylglucosamine--N-acetylmuramyl-(pentapeptide) pyrophosphoryl-undecaprenol N-acetylglucosamine transferase